MTRRTPNHSPDGPNSPGGTRRGPPPPPGSDLRGLVKLVARLRAPDGCPWDREQGPGAVRAYLLEEAHELAAALDRVLGGDEDGWRDVREEAGDVLFQVAFLLRLAQEDGRFEPAEVLDGNHAKMVARHPHVFGEAVAEDVASVARLWERNKSDGRETGDSLLDGVTTTLPALLAAYRIGQKVAAVGFDWPAAEEVLDKVEEELAELRQALADRETEERREAADDAPVPGEVPEEVAEEMGDLLFTVAQLARQLGIDPEAALAAGNAKFRRRFRQLEHGVDRRGLVLGDVDLETLEELWREVKAREKVPLRDEVRRSSPPVDDAESA